MVATIPLLPTDGGVGENTKGPKLANDRPNKKVKVTVDVEVHAAPIEQDQQAPIKHGERMCMEPGDILGSATTGKSLDVAWERVLIRSLTFN